MPTIKELTPYLPDVIEKLNKRTIFPSLTYKKYRYLTLGSSIFDFKTEQFAFTKDSNNKCHYVYLKTNWHYIIVKYPITIENQFLGYGEIKYPYDSKDVLITFSIK